MNARIAVLTKAVLVALLGLSVVAQLLLIPATISGFAVRFPEVAGLVPPAIAWAVAVVLCVQAVLVVTWRLVTFTESERIFSAEAVRWVRAMIVAALAVAVLAIGAFAGLNLAQINPPGLMMALLGMGLLAVAFGLIIRTMLVLLRRATEFSEELRAVV